MRVAHTDSWRESVPLTRPYSIAGRHFESVELFFLRLTADDGSVGLGSASPAGFVTGESPEACAAALAPAALEDLIGLDPRRTPGRPADRGRPRRPAEPATPAAHAAVDMALWDLHGKALGRPVVDLLGRCQRALPTSVTVGISPVEETLAEAADWLGRGFDHLKVKLGDDLELDLERLAKLRERWGGRIAIRIDVNQGYGRREVERLFTAAAGLDLELIEQPLERGRERELAGLATPAPLAADESLLDARDALVEAEEGSPYQIFNIKLMKCGGIGPARAISAVADTAGRDLMWGSMDESRLSIAAALHVAYACPRTRYLDLDGSFDLARDPAAGGFEVRGGRLELAAGPGLGVKLASGD